MKTGVSHSFPRGAIAGASLIELLMYLGLLFVFVGIAYGAVDRLWLETRRLEKRADALRGMIQAGETWREDIRRATGEPKVEVDSLGISIPAGTNRIRWRVEMSAGIATRDGGGDDLRIYPWPLKSATFAPARRDAVAGWMWELTLVPPTHRDRQAQVVRFLAVPGGKDRP